MELQEKEWFIEAPWGRICIVAWGDCFSPPVLLCHGSVDSAVSFRPLVRLLPQSFYYIAMEIPGNGKSDSFPPGLMLSLYDLAYAVEAVVKHFRWQHFIYIGHSLGTSIGKIYNVSYPGKITKYIELDPINFTGITPDQFGDWYEFFFTSYFDNYDKYNKPKELATKHKWSEAVESLIQKRGLTKDTAIATLERWSETVEGGLIRYTFDQRIRLVTLPCFSPDHIRTIFTNTKTPTLIIVSQQSLNEGLFRNTAFLIDEQSYANKNCRVKIVDGNHDLHIIIPEAISHYVKEFMLRGLEGLDLKAKL